MGQLKEFKEKALGDEAFAGKFEGVTTPEELVEKAGKEGFAFTVEDVKNNTELTDAELAAVAGGGTSIILGRDYFIYKRDSRGSERASAGKGR